MILCYICMIILWFVSVDIPLGTDGKAELFSHSGPVYNNFTPLSTISHHFNCQKKTIDI